MGLLGGSLADAVDRRKLTLVTSSCLAVVSAGFAAQAFLGLGQLWLLYVLAAGVALNQLSGYVSVLLGPVLAGVLTAAAGLRVCYLIDALSFGAALYGVARLPAMPPQESAARPGLRAAAAGLRFIRQHPILVGAFLADMDAMLFGLPIALFPALNAAASAALRRLSGCSPRLWRSAACSAPGCPVRPGGSPGRAGRCW